MMPTVNLFDAKNRLSVLIDQVEEGQEVTITRRGKPVARLVPIEAQVEAARRAVAKLHALRAGIAARGQSFTWTELKEYRDAGRP